MEDGKAKLALLISASLIAAVRTARVEIKPTPKLVGSITESIALARMILERLNRE